MLTTDQTRYIQCLRKKRLTHVEADAVVRNVQNGKGGRTKGKRRKQNHIFVAYFCQWCDHWHVGHDRRLLAQNTERRGQGGDNLTGT